MYIMDRNVTMTKTKEGMENVIKDGDLGKFNSGKSTFIRPSFIR